MSTQMWNVYNGKNDYIVYAEDQVIALNKVADYRWFSSIDYPTFVTEEWVVEVVVMINGVGEVG